MRSATTVFVTDQLLAHFEDWTPLTAPEGMRIEARAVPTDDPNVFDIQTRYTRTGDDA